MGGSAPVTTPCVLIDASNLRGGGGLQVGASVVDELAGIASEGDPRWPWLGSARVQISPEVLLGCTRELSALDIEVVAGSPLRSLTKPRAPRRYDVALTIFGPDYAPRRARRQIVGFADGTSLWPELAHATGPTRRSKACVRRHVSRAAFRRADTVITESAHTAAALVARWRLPPSQVEVVPNTVNAVFGHPGGQLAVHLPAAAGNTLCYPTRAYPHKNIDILGAAAEELARQGAPRSTFVLTLTEREWLALSASTREAAINVGPLPVAAMPSLYRACDAAIFPSLLESFSVTPLEALASRAPLAASDRSFVREVAGEAALYFDPLDPRSIAASIVRLFGDPDATAARVSVGQRRAQAWPSARSRAERYLTAVARHLDGAP